MKKVLILYANATRNTEEIACLLEKHIDQTLFKVTLNNIEIDEMDPKKLLLYDGILFGTYTYDDGDLPFETDIFCDSLETIDLTGKAVGVFGSGDLSYFDFCGAVDSMQELFRHANAAVIEHTVKVDLYPDEEEELLSNKMLADLFQQALANSMIGNL